METLPNPQVYDLGHLGRVASILDRIRLVENVDRFVGPRPGEKVSTGMALRAAVLNALSFVCAPLYLFGHLFQGKPTELLNDDRVGRMLDTLYAAGVTELFLEVAVHRRYEETKETEEEGGATRITYGYSRDHRPDLQQWVMNLVCADTGGFPCSLPLGDGNQSDQEAQVPLSACYRQGLDLGEVVVLDGASYPPGPGGVLLDSAGARALLEGAFPEAAWWRRWLLAGRAGGRRPRAAGGAGRKGGSWPGGWPVPRTPGGL